MRRFGIMILSAFLLSIIACGKNTDQNGDHNQAYKKAEEERLKEIGYEPPPPTLKGPEIPADSVKPGTCAETALKFAQAMVAVDSLTAPQYCSDTVRVLVKALFMNRLQLQGMIAARDSGFTVRSVAIQEYSPDSTLCTACIKTAIKDREMEDCSFRLRLENGRWKIYKFGS